MSNVILSISIAYYSINIAQLLVIFAQKYLLEISTEDLLLNFLLWVHFSLFFFTFTWIKKLSQLFLQSALTFTRVFFFNTYLYFHLSTECVYFCQRRSVRASWWRTFEYIQLVILERLLRVFGLTEKYSRVSSAYQWQEIKTIN